MIERDLETLLSVHASPVRCMLILSNPRSEHARRPACSAATGRFGGGLPIVRIAFVSDYFLIGTSQRATSQRATSQRATGR